MAEPEIGWLSEAEVWRSHARLLLALRTARVLTQNLVTIREALVAGDTTEAILGRVDTALTDPGVAACLADVQAEEGDEGQ